MIVMQGIAIIILSALSLHVQEIPIRRHGSAATVFQYISFDLDPFHRLTSHKISSSVVESMEDCAMKCVMRWERCISFNLGNSTTNKQCCELISTDKYNSIANYTHSDNFHHFFKKNKCGSNKTLCKNGGTCYPIYENNDYRCVCSADYTGRHCEGIQLQESSPTFDKVELFSGKSCLEWLKRGYTSSGVHNVPSRKGIDDPRVYCDMITDGGGWMVILRRVNNDSLNFDRTWNKYIFTFGDLLRSYWHGLGNLRRFTDHGRFSRQELRVDLEDWDGNTAFAKYSTFRVAPEEDFFRLTVDGYSGTAGDGLSSSNGMAFISKDSDNDMNVDNNCAVQAWGGWWFKNCFQAFCTGRFSNLVWAPWKGFNYALKKCEMKIRPIT